MKHAHGSEADEAESPHAYANKPEAWNLHIVLGIGTVPGIAGVIESFGLFYLAECVFHLDREFIRSLM